jgi:sterol desaturase/sphingolipid hydroxylase (fatty acid hydroxylase superfamily)
VTLALIPWILAGVMTSAFVIEALVSYFLLRHRHYGVADTFVCVAIAVGYVAARVAIGALVALIFFGIYELTPLRWSMAWWHWIVLFVVNDFFYYWSHRASHTYPFMWASHAVHHNTERFNLSIGLRNSWVGGLIDWVFIAPVVALGFHPLAVGVVVAVMSTWDFLSHTPYVGRLPWFDAWANSPANHRVHHAQNARYLDKNLGGALIIWDRMFGTYAPLEEPAVFGIAEMPARPRNPFYVELYLWGAMLRRAVARGELKHVAEVEVDAAALGAAAVIEGAKRGEVPADA